jgi:hypothetical protein
MGVPEAIIRDSSLAALIMCGQWLLIREMDGCGASVNWMRLQPPPASTASDHGHAT